MHSLRNRIYLHDTKHTQKWQLTWPCVSEQQPRLQTLTYNFSTRVLSCDGNSAGGTLIALLKPELDTGCTEHMVVTADHRLTDLRTRDKRKGQCDHDVDRMCSGTWHKYGWMSKMWWLFDQGKKKRSCFKWITSGLQLSQDVTPKTKSH